MKSIADAGLKFFFFFFLPAFFQLLIRSSSGFKDNFCDNLDCKPSELSLSA